VKVEVWSTRGKKMHKGTGFPRLTQKRVDCEADLIYSENSKGEATREGYRLFGLAQSYYLKEIERGDSTGREHCARKEGRSDRVSARMR